MLLLEVLLSLSIVAVLSVMLMGNLGYLFVRGQKEKASFAEEVQMQILDMTILKLFEELSIHLPISAKGHLPLYIEEREGKKNLIFYILHSQDAEGQFTGMLKCTLFNEKGTLKLLQENEEHKKRETEILKMQSIRFEFFDPEVQEWTDVWVKEKENPPPLLRVIITKEEDQKQRGDSLYYLTPFFKTPLPI